MEEVTKVELDRLRDENNRQNRRIQLLEQNVEAQKSIATSVEKLAIHMEQMLKEQEKQGDRLTKLEQEPGNRWNSLTGKIMDILIGAIAGAFATGVIYIIAQSVIK